MKVLLYNFLTRKKKVFKPLKKGRVGLYTCGPTVYNYPHIGNYRAYVFEDVLRRTLEYAGYEVKHIMNITDVDDKTIRDSQAAGKTLKDFTNFYAEAFFRDLKKLNIEEASKYPTATGHIKKMISIINILLKKAVAYKSGDGIYFDISKFKKYGRLSRLKKREIKVGARIAADEYEKSSAQDFVLWKAEKPGEPSWPAKFGAGRSAFLLAGRPGWHIECSAMSVKYLGQPFDIHAGGIDLLFPHHENEVAQSEAATGKKFVKYFLEGEHLLVDGKKMSKSLGNIFTLRDITDKNLNPLAFRYLTLSAHYRKQLNFTWDSLRGAQTSLNRLKEFILDLQRRQQAPQEPAYFPAGKSLVSHRRAANVPAGLLPSASAFQKAVFDDLDTPKALAVVWKLINDYNKTPWKYDAGAVLNVIFEFDKVLALGLKDIKEESVSEEVEKLLQERENARKSRDFTSADILRQKIYDLGWEIQDTPDGPLLKKF